MLESNGEELVDPGRTTNNAAIITRVDFDSMSWLLTADAEAPVEHMLVTQTNLKLLNVDVLKAGHHGSKTSTTFELLQAATPASVVISVGKDNKYGHPNKETLQHLVGIPTFRTDQNGSVRFIHTATGWVMSCSSSQCVKSS